MTAKKDSFWKRLRYKYRISAFNEDKLTESWHIRLNWLGVFTVVFLFFLMGIGTSVALLFYTPMRNVLPGYSDSLRQDLLDSSIKVDSLESVMHRQSEYLEIVRGVVAGEVHPDSVLSLDSVMLLPQDQLVISENDVVKEFLSEYEGRVSNELQIFDEQNVVPTLTFFAPVQGVVAEHMGSPKCPNGVLVRVANKERVSAVLAGTIVDIHLGADNLYSVVIQHSAYLSIYHALGRVIQQEGSYVQAGECIGECADNQLFSIELWKDGACVNPENVIAF